MSSLAIDVLMSVSYSSINVYFRAEDAMSNEIRILHEALGPS